MPILNLVEKVVDSWFALLPRTAPSTAQVANARLVAHRGAHDSRLGIIENTDEAFERAVSLDCWGIEFDIHACADEVLVVNHDPTLQRLWGHDIAINSTDFNTMRSTVPSIPTLEEVVARYGKQIHLFIELKAPFAATKALVDTLSPLTPGVDYHLLSLDERLFSTLNEFPTESLLLVPVHNNIGKFCSLSLQQQYGGILGHYFLLANQQIKKLTAARQIAGVGFVDSKYSLYRELNRGINYIFSNNVADVSASLRALAAANSARR